MGVAPRDGGVVTRFPRSKGQIAFKELHVHITPPRLMASSDCEWSAPRVER
jgi:hypothetical protein